MSYSQYPYNVFNQELLADQARQQMIIYEQIRYQNEQLKYILEMKKAIDDFCSAAKKVSPEYQQYAMNVILADVLNRMTEQ